MCIVLYSNSSKSSSSTLSAVICFETWSNCQKMFVKQILCDLSVTSSTVCNECVWPTKTDKIRQSISFLNDMVDDELIEVFDDYWRMKNGKGGYGISILHTRISSIQCIQFPLSPPSTSIYLYPSANQTKCLLVIFCVVCLFVCFKIISRLSTTKTKFTQNDY